MSEKKPYQIKIEKQLFDTEKMSGEDMLYDKDAKSVEEIAVDHYIFRRLTEGIKELNEWRLKMIVINEKFHIVSVGLV